MSKASIALLDPHVMFRKGLIELINQFGNYSVIIDSCTTDALVAEFKMQQLPNILLLEIEMQPKNGYDTTLWLKKNYPTIKVIALSAVYSDFAISKMIINGACGFVTKDAAPHILKLVLEKVFEPGFVAGGINGLLVQKMLPAVFKHIRQYISANISDKEILFLQMCCTGLTYIQIAEKLSINEKAVDRMREKLFVKLDVKNRTQLAVFTLENGLGAPPIIL